MPFLAFWLMATFLLAAGPFLQILLGKWGINNSQKLP